MLPNIIYPTITIIRGIKYNDWVIELGKSFTQQIDQGYCPIITHLEIGNDQIGQNCWSLFITQLDIAHTFTQPLVFTNLYPTLTQHEGSYVSKALLGKKIWVKYWVNLMAKMGKNLLAICWVYDLSVV